MKLIPKIMTRRWFSYGYMLGLTLGGSQSVLAEASLITADENLLMMYCSQCHAPPNPAKYTPQHWQQIVHRMQNHRIIRGFNKISDQDATRLIEHLEINSRKK